MPYLHLDLPLAVAPVDRAEIAGRLARTYADVMETNPERVTVAFRELGENGVVRLRPDRAIATVAGNGTLDKVTYNARRVCTLGGIRDMPIAAGADRPLRRALETAAHVHGESALDGPELPEPDVELDPRPAHEVISAGAAESTEPLTIVAVGP